MWTSVAVNGGGRRGSRSYGLDRHLKCILWAAAAATQSVNMCVSSLGVRLFAADMHMFLHSREHKDGLGHYTVTIYFLCISVNTRMNKN